MDLPINSMVISHGYVSYNQMVNRIPSNKLTRSCEKWPSKIDDVPPIKKMVIFHVCVNLPEGIPG